VQDRPRNSSALPHFRKKKDNKGMGGFDWQWGRTEKGPGHRKGGETAPALPSVGVSKSKIGTTKRNKMTIKAKITLKGTQDVLNGGWQALS